jgi:hypothetical protein
MTSEMSMQTTRPLCGTVTLMLVGACLFGAPSSAPAQTADKIIAANIAASGGEEAIARIKNFTSTGRVTVESPLFGKLEGTLEAVRVPGRGYYEHVVLGPIRQNKGWDGTRGGSKVRPVSERSKASSSRRSRSSRSSTRSSRYGRSRPPACGSNGSKTPRCAAGLTTSSP